MWFGDFFTLGITASQCRQYCCSIRFILMPLSFDI